MSRSDQSAETVLYKASPSMWRHQPIGFLLLLVSVVGWPILLLWYLRCIAKTLTITNKRSTLRRGILSKSISEVWHDNVRNVQLSQSLSQRLFGVGTLGISSAGQAGMEIEIAGIPNPEKAKTIIDSNR